MPVGLESTGLYGLDNTPKDKPGFVERARKDIKMMNVSHENSGQKMDMNSLEELDRPKRAYLEIYNDDLF